MDKLNPHILIYDGGDINWMDQANCKNEDPNVMVPAVYSWRYAAPETTYHRNNIKPIIDRCCKPCPVKKECLTYGVTTHSIGIWGGRFLTRNNRRQTLAHHEAIKNYDVG